MVVAGTACLRLSAGTPVGICSAVTLAVTVVRSGRGALAALFGLGARAERGLSGAVALAVTVVLGGLARAENGSSGSTGLRLALFAVAREFLAARWQCIRCERVQANLRFALNSPASSGHA